MMKLTTALTIYVNTGKCASNPPFPIRVAFCIGPVSYTHLPSGYCDASGVCSARLPDPCGTLSGEKQTEYCGTAAGGRVKKMKILEDIGIRYAGIFFFYIKEIIAKKYKKV